jgi:hypothetical protein
MRTTALGGRERSGFETPTARFARGTRRNGRLYVPPHYTRVHTSLSCAHAQPGCTQQRAWRRAGGTPRRRSSRQRTALGTAVGLQNGFYWVHGSGDGGERCMIGARGRRCRQGGAPVWRGRRRLGPDAGRGSAELPAAVRRPRAARTSAAAAWRRAPLQRRALARGNATCWRAHQRPTHGGEDGYAWGGFGMRDLAGRLGAGKNSGRIHRSSKGQPCARRRQASLGPYIVGPSPRAGEPLRGAARARGYSTPGAPRRARRRAAPARAAAPPRRATAGAKGVVWFWQGHQTTGRGGWPRGRLTRESTVRFSSL